MNRPVLAVTESGLVRNFFRGRLIALHHDAVHPEAAHHEYQTFSHLGQFNLLQSIPGNDHYTCVQTHLLFLIGPHTGHFGPRGNPSFRKALSSRLRTAADSLEVSVSELFSPGSLLTLKYLPLS